MPQVLARIENHHDGFRHLQRENVLGVMCRAGGVAVAPPRKDCVFVGELPVDNAAESSGIDSGFLAQLAHRGFSQCLAGLLAARYGLPKARVVRALEQQHAQIRRVDENQRRDGDLVRQCIAPHPNPLPVREERRK